MNLMKRVNLVSSLFSLTFFVGTKSNWRGLKERKEGKTWVNQVETTIYGVFLEKESEKLKETI